MNKTRTSVAVLAFVIMGTIANGQQQTRTTSIEYGYYNSRSKLKQQIRLLIEKPVQEELKLSEEQIKKLTPVRLVIYKKFSTWAEVPDDDEEVWRLAIHEMNAMIDQELKVILSAEQHKRLKQIARRVIYRRYLGLYTLLLDPEHAKNFGLSESQMDTLKGMRKGLEDSELAAHNHPGDEQYKAKNYAYIKSIDRKIEETLTPAQRGKLKDLLGTEIDAKIDLPGR